MEYPTYKMEEELKGLGFKYIVGTDEAGRGCERVDAEILTQQGWKNYKDLTEIDKVFSYTKEGCVVWQAIDFVVEKEVTANLIELSNRSVHICVTDDHYFDVLRRTFKRDENYKLKLTGYTYKGRVKVNDLKVNDFIPRGGNWLGVDKKFFVLPAVEKVKHDNSAKDYSEKTIDMETWLKFLGIYMSEGSCTHSKNGAYVVKIKQCKKDNLNLIYKELTKLPFKLFKEKDAVIIRNKQLYKYVEKFGKCYNKYIPAEFKNLSPKYLNILLDWLILGDGSSYKGKNRKRVYMYYTTSKRLSDDVEEIILKIGKTYKTSVRAVRDSYIRGKLIKKENCVPCYEIRIRQNTKITVKHLHKKLIPYTGKVFCLGLPEHHNFYVRRSGSGYFTGNCGSGPVMAAAVCISEEALPELLGKVNDSKKMTEKKREELYDTIIKTCNVGVQDISAQVIDEINILEATKVAMRSSIEQLEYFDYILIDGTVDLTKHIVCPQQKVIKGDAKSVSIAAASIVAKVTRDRLMLDLHEKWPIYGWDKNKGYLTKKHLEALNTYGPCPYHRMSFRKVGR